MSSKKFLTVEQLLAVLEESDSEDEVINDVKNSKEVNAIYIPPNCDEVSDIENLDEDLIVENVPINVDIAGEIELEYESNAENSNRKRARLQKDAENLECVPNFGTPKWKKRMLSFSKEPVNIEENKIETLYEKIAGMTPTQLFSLFCNEEIIDSIVNQSNLYASQNNTVLNVKPFEIRRFLGFMFFTGYHTLPEWKNYWSTDPSFGIQIVKNAFPRQRVEDIKRYLHLANNNNLDTNDKFAKLRPFVNLCNQNFMQFGIFAHNLSIDEQMIPYFGRHSCKMFIRGKPIRFGFKAWCLASSDGYLYQTMFYGGASTAFNKNIGLGASVVLELLKNVEPPSCHRIFMDYFFTSYKLLCLLNERHFFATGKVSSISIK